MVCVKIMKKKGHVAQYKMCQLTDQKSTQEGILFVYQTL